MGKTTTDIANPFRDHANLPERLRWDDLEVLLAVGRAGTLSGAAAELGVNTSTVARRLDAMEAGLGVHLFDRRPTGLGATELAESLMPVAEAMERAAADALRLVAGRETQPVGTVRLTAPPGVANWILAPALGELRARYRRLSIELDASVGYADLTRREADIALRMGRPRGGDLVATRLVSTDFVAVAAPSVTERGNVRDPDDLDWIAWSDDLSHLDDARWLSAHVSPERIALKTRSMDAQIHAAKAGLGALLLPRPFVAITGLTPVRWTRGGAKRLAAMPSGALWMVGHRALRNVPRIEAVWSFLLERATTWK